MTSVDAPRFATTIAALAVATRLELDDPTIELYFNALEDVPIDLLEAAAVELAKSAQFFPKPAEWRTAVDAILDRQERLEAGHRQALPSGAQAQLPGAIGEPWRCPDCDDTGWVYPPDYSTNGRRVVRCTNEDCRQHRADRAARRRRYAKGD